MQTWVALLRGINVGGRNKMAMTDLSSVLELAGCRSVRTYIQSGNVVFESSNKKKSVLSDHLGSAIEERFGFRPSVLLFSEADFRRAVVNNPFFDSVADPKTLHFYFLESLPISPDLGELGKVAVPSERYSLIETVLYLHAPEGVGRSKFASSAERKLGIPSTARNYNTVLALLALLDGD